ncbi:MAG: squalene--hopene cyclase [bacterium]
MSGAVSPDSFECWQGTTYGYATFPAPEPRSPRPSAGRGRVDRAVERSRQYLLGLQNAEDGYWVGEVEANSTLTSEYVFFMHFMETVDDLRQRKMVHYLKETQLPDGSWNIFFGGPGDLSTTLEAYAAMRLAGEDPNERAMKLARDFILGNGGIEKSRVFTKIFLAILGVRPWTQCPALSPEILLLPVGFPLSIYEMSSWARSTVVPLLVLWDHKPTIRPPRHFTLDELRGERPGLPKFDENGNGAAALDGWGKFFVFSDGVLKLYDRKPIPWLRRKALRLAEQWILERQDPTGEWGGIMPAMMNSVMALKCLGYPLTHPAVRKGLEAIHRFAIEDAKTLRLQSCVSPVWDTANTCLALLESGLPGSHPAIRKAADWLWSKQTKEKGDWAIKNTRGKPGGWSFEFENHFYPDTDDTLAVLTVLNQTCSKSEQAEAWHLGLQWLLSMQSKNGGWGAFDVDNVQELWNRIPFADHKSMLDAPTADLTGRVLEFLGRMNYRSDLPAVARGIRFVEARQEPDGSWFGRWGINYLYGTWCALCGLQAVGYDMNTPRVRRAVDWLLSCQNPDGGWGESCLSYDDLRFKAKGRSTPSQTSWALMGLTAAGEAGSEAAQRAVDYLLAKQNGEGSWDEQEFTGTGFPRFFYLRYHMYRDYFPLLALSRYLQARES